MKRIPMRVVFFVISGLVFALATGVYAYHREVWLSQILSHSALRMVDVPWPAYLLDSLPSFLFVFAFSTLHFALGGLTPRNIARIPLIWLVVGVVHELAQGLAALFGTSVGDFDPRDIVAVGLAYGMVLLLAKALARHVSGEENVPRFVGRDAFVIVLGLCGATATSVQPTKGDPVYMSYADLRAAVAFEKADPAKKIQLEKPGKIYVYLNYLFVSSINQGVQIFDITDIANPVSLGFLKVPGNLDIAIKDGILYVDSYIDLVSVDLRDTANIHEIGRQLDTFPYNPYQNVDKREVILVNVDSSKGVVVGYTERKEK